MLSVEDRNASADFYDNREGFATLDIVLTLLSSFTIHRVVTGHAFSVFEDPRHQGVVNVFVQENGDWTSTLKQYMLQAGQQVSRPAWISGPYVHFAKQSC